MITVYSHNSILGLYLTKSVTLHEFKYIITNNEESGKGRCLMIRPKILLHLIIKHFVVILAHADIYYQTFPPMYFFEILGDVVD